MSRFRLPSLPQPKRQRQLSPRPDVLTELKEILEQLATGEVVIISAGSEKALSIAVAVAEEEARRRLQSEVD